MDLDLAAVGVGRSEEAVYRALLEQPGADLAMLGAAVGLSARAVRGALTQLERDGLISRLPGRRARFTPGAPDVAIEALIRRRESDLERLRSQAVRLGEHFQQIEAAIEGVELEVFSEPAAYAARFEQLQLLARREVLIFDRPPYYVQGDPLSNDIEMGLLERGIGYRVIYDRSCFGSPGRLTGLEALIAAGEQARVVPELPMKLAIADGEVAMLPPTVHGRGSVGIFVRRSALLDALTALFEAEWTRALPISIDGKEDTAREDGLSATDRRLLVLLASGLQDEAIALQMGIGTRTVSRRVRELMDRLGVATRFQAGVAAARQGWL